MSRRESITRLDSTGDIPTTPMKENNTETSLNEIVAKIEPGGVISRNTQTKKFKTIKDSKLMVILNNRLESIKYIRKTLFLKYAHLRRLTIIFQVSIILCSTTITFLESLSGHLHVRESRLKISSIVLSTYIAISTSIIKFLKIDDKKEEIYKLMEVFSNHEKIINSKKDKIKMIYSRKVDNEEYNMDPSMNYQEEFQQVYREIEDENIINELYESIARYDAVISYKEKMYYKGKIVENLLLENVHDSNYSFLIHEKHKHESSEDTEHVYGNNFCNNLCLYFSYICHFCLIMQLYYFLDSHRRKERENKKTAPSVCSVKSTGDFIDDNVCCCCHCCGNRDDEHTRGICGYLLDCYPFKSCQLPEKQTIELYQDPDQDYDQDQVPNQDQAPDIENGN